jgi:hypothetical protein
MIANLSNSCDTSLEIGKLYSLGGAMKKLLIAGAALTALIGTHALA